MMRRAMESVGGWSLSIAGHLAVFALVGGLSWQAPPTDQPSATESAAAMPVVLIIAPALSDEPPTAETTAPDLPAPDAPGVADMPAMPVAPPVTPLTAARLPDRPAAPVLFDSVPAVQATAPPPPPEPHNMAPQNVAPPAPASPPSPAVDVVLAAPPMPEPPTPEPAGPKLSKPAPLAKSPPAPPKPAAKAPPTAAPRSGPSGAAAKAQHQGGSSSKALLASWGKGIMAALARQSVRGRDMPKGTVTLALNIDTTGRLVSARIARSSGHAVLDQAALTAVGRARFPAAPKGMTPGRHAFTLPVASR